MPRKPAHHVANQEVRDQGAGVNPLEAQLGATGEQVPIGDQHGREESEYRADDRARAVRPGYEQSQEEHPGHGGEE